MGIPKDNLALKVYVCILKCKILYTDMHEELTDQKLATYISQNLEQFNKMDVLKLQSMAVNLQRHPYLI